PRMEGAVALDTPVLLFTLVLAISTGLLFGIAPALTGVTRLKDSATLIAGGVRSGVSRGQKRARSFLVIAEIALALVLLTGAGLLIRSFWALRTVDPGFDAHNVLTMEMSVEGTRFETPATLGRLIENADRRLRNLPGVVAAAASYSLPLYDQTGGRFTIEAHPDDVYSVDWALVSKGYFDVFRIPLLAGRFLSEWDDRDSPPVAIANETMAKGHSGELHWVSTRFPWRDGTPIGERITIGTGRGPHVDRTREIVGVGGPVELPLSRRGFDRRNDRLLVFGGTQCGCCEALFQRALKVPGRCRPRVVEQDHRAIKRRVNASQGFRSFEGAWRTLQGYEVLHMIRKGEVRWLPKGDVVGQVQFVNDMFGLKAA